MTFLADEVVAEQEGGNRLADGPVADHHRRPLHPAAARHGSGQLLPQASPTAGRLLAMLAGLAVSLPLIAFASRTDRRLSACLPTFFLEKSANVVFTLGGVMVFQAMLDASGLLPEAGRQLDASMVPVEFVVGFLPFLAGLVTGIAIGFAGPAFPAGGRPDLGERPPVPGFRAGPGLQHGLRRHDAVTGSPLLHILTRRYFVCDLLPFLRVPVLPCVLTVAGWGIAMHRPSPPGRLVT
jgi:hypothetical protein